MEEDTGRAGGAGVAEEEPFPSQLRLHFLCGEEVPCWAHGDLTSVVRSFRPGEQRRFEPAATGGELRNKARGLTHTCTKTYTRLSWLSQWKTYTHPHSRLTGNSAAWNKKALPVLTGARSQRGSNQNPMSCPLHHYHHHSGDITAHLLIATRPYLCLQPPNTQRNPLTDDPCVDQFLYAEVRFSFRSQPLIEIH